jgi:hypothetical protein
MLTTKETRQALAERGVEVSYSNLALWVRSGKFPGAELIGGKVWLIPSDAVARFEPPVRGWPKGRARKTASAKSPAKRRGRKAA